MNELFQNIFGQNFIPHGYCLSWNKGLLWTLVGADLVIAIAYFSIPFALWYFAKKKPDVRQAQIIWLFGLFIIACGVTHLFDVVNIWRPMYWENAFSKVFTAIVSIATAIVLWRIMPAALQAPSHQQLEEVNRHLEEARAELESRVAERTEALANSEEQLRMVLEGAELGFWDWNIVTGEVQRNERWANMLGYSHAEIVNTVKQWTDFIHPDDRAKAWQSISDVLEGKSAKHRLEYRMLHKDGSMRWILDQANVMQRDAQGHPTRMSGTHSDVTERKQLEMELLRQAHIDYLTGASTRGYFMEQAELELSRSVRYQTPLSLLMLDVDFFKQVNDVHGHRAGDEVLKKLVQVCQEHMRGIDIIGRLGGEEFAILLPSTDVEKAAEAAERLREVTAATNVQLPAGSSLHFTVSIGVTALESMEDNLDMLLSQADKGLYKAKRTGRNKVCVVRKSQ